MSFAGAKESPPLRAGGVYLAEKALAERCRWGEQYEGLFLGLKWRGELHQWF